MTRLPRPPPPLSTTLTDADTRPHTHTTIPHTHAHTSHTHTGHKPQLCSHITATHTQSHTHVCTHLHTHISPRWANLPGSRGLSSLSTLPISSLGALGPLLEALPGLPAPRPISPTGGLRPPRKLGTVQSTNPAQGSSMRGHRPPGRAASPAAPPHPHLLLQTLPQQSQKQE